MSYEANSPKQDSPVDTCLANINQRIEIMNDLLGKLEARLCRVMTPDVPMPSNKVAGGVALREGVPQPLAPLCQELVSICGRLDNRLETIKRLTDSLAL